jgi:hypothetical protein
VKLHIADYDWIYTISGNHLHHPQLTEEQHVECADWGGLYDEPVTLDCGRSVTTIMIPGFFSRGSAPRCSACCKATGLPEGKGSPKNDDRCRTILGMDREDDQLAVHRVAMASSDRG